MKPERWQQLDRLFHSALEREPEERAAFLDEACAGDQQLRTEVEALIAANEQAGSFIEKPALEVEARSLANGPGHDRVESMVGKTIGHYRVMALLGSGGMGEVYLAQDTVLGRTVALKVLPAALTKDSDRLRRFEQEARAASALNHPNIVTIHEIGHDDSFHFIAQEFIDGVTLRTRLDSKPLALNEALEIAMQAASALAAAHAKGIVHRDIKPENIMVDKRSHLGSQNHVKVLDFGIAKLAEIHGMAMKGEATTRLLVRTEEGRAIGTAAYMSPEQARGTLIDPRTDLWSLGVVLYEMLSRVTPFRGHTAQDVIASILREDPAALSREMPDRLRWIVEKALRKDRDERYQTAMEMFSDLRDLNNRLEVRAVEHTPSSRPRAQVRPTGNSANVHGPDSGRVAVDGSVQSLFGKVGHLGTTSIVLVLVALLVVIGAIVFGLYKFTSGNQRQTSQNQTKANVSSQSMKMTRLTTTGKASAAAISPDGKLVVHVVDDGKQQSLWIRQVSTSSNVQIIPPAEVTYLGLTFSPGGDYLYYVLWDRKSYWTLYQMPMLGGAAKRLTQDIDSNVTFSPDGKQYAFLRGYPTQGKVAVLVADADGTAERSLTTHALVSGPSGDPAWSPDGKIIACPVENNDANGDFMALVEVRVADGSGKPIGSQRWSRLGRMAWLRDGSGLVFTAKESVASPSQIWYISYPGGEAHRITNDLNDYLDVSLAADSSALVTVQSEQASNIWTAPHENTSRATQVTSSKFDGLQSVSWTPDGKIVYDSAASGHLDLWMIEANGTGGKQLTSDAGNNSWPSVSPDGRYVVFVSDRTGTNHVWRMDIDGSNVTQLTSGNGESNPQCSPAGQWVLFNSRFSDAPLMKVPIAGGEPVPIKAKYTQGIAISPDGKWIASTHWEPANINTAIYPFDGGEPRQFIDVASNYRRWTPDGRSLAFVDDRNPSAIISQPINSGPPRQLADFKPDRIFSFAWSHDGKQLAVARGTLTHDVILIRNFLDQQ